MSRQLARLLGGDLELKSEAGRAAACSPGGFPAPVDSLEVPAPVISTADLSSLRVLVLEDNKVNQLLATSRLESAGASSEVAENGRVALGRLQQLDGLETTHQPRRDTRFDALPIVASTAHALDEERERCLAAGMNGSLRKPIDVALFYETSSRLTTRAG
ncbi:MAG: response regulator [Archangium sp.]